MIMRCLFSAATAIFLSGIATSALSAMPRAVVVEMGPGGTAGFAAELAAAAREAGYEATLLPADALGRADSLVGRCDLLVVPEAGKLPCAAFEGVEPYLKSAKAVLVLGAPLWPDPAVRVGGQWMSSPEWSRRLARIRPQHELLDFSREDPKRWLHSFPLPRTDGTIEMVGGDSARALHVSMAEVGGWDTRVREGLSFPQGDLLTCFRAKGGPNTRQLSVEWQEKNESRWIAVVDLSTEWKSYALPPSAFRYWTGDGSRGRLNVAEAVRFTIGLSDSHTPQAGPGPHEYWIADLGTAPGRNVDSSGELPTLISLSPWNQFFPITGPVSLSTAEGQALVARQTLAAQGRLLGLHPRPAASGFDKDRPWRWQPLIEARAPDGDYRGAVAALVVHLKGIYRGGAWAVFTPSDAAFYRQAAMRGLLRQTMARLRGGPLLQEGGAACYTYFEDQAVRLGARVLALGPGETEPAVVHVRVSQAGDEKPLFERQWPVSPRRGETVNVSDVWQSPQWPAGGCQVAVELRTASGVADRLCHEIHVLRPHGTPQFIESRDGGFWLQGKPWKAHGINYMPSSGIALPLEMNDLFEHYLGAAAYDPAVIDRDLRRVRGMGFNAISIFLAHGHMRAQNLIDLTRRCEELGLHVNLSLRPGSPMDFPWKMVREMIEFLRLAQNDTVFAYDLDWEPMHGPYENRRKYRGDWVRWVVARYGSLADAEKAWGVPGAASKEKPRFPNSSPAARRGSSPSTTWHS